MKKLVTAFFFIAISILFTIPAFAANNGTYRIEEMGMSVQVPSGLYAFTRDTDNNDPNLYTVGLYKKTILKLLSDDGYMLIIPKNFDYEIVIAQSELDGRDYNQLSECELIAKGESFASEPFSDGSTCRYEVYTNSQTRFLKLYKEKDGAVIMITYLTIVNGNWISFIMLGDSNITTEMENNLRQIIDSTTFDNALPFFTISNTPTEFSDEETGVGFTVPAGWGKCEVDDILCTQFKDNNGNNFYYFNDEKNLEEEKGRSVFTETDAREFCYMPDYTITSVEQITYNHIDYFKVTQTGDEDSSYFTTYLLYFDGKIYEFSFMGIEGFEAYDDVTSILSSVKYDKIQNTALKYYLGLPVLSLKDQIVTLVLLSILLTILIYALPLIIFRFGIKKAPFPKDKALVITLIYGISFFIIAMGLSLLNAVNRIPALTIIFWSIVNFLILKSGKAKIVPDYAYVNANPDNVIFNPYPYNTYSNTNYAVPSTIPDFVSTSAAPNNENPVMIAAAENAVITETAPTVSDSPVPISKENEAQFCRKCGHALAPESIFCTSCGTKI